MKDDRGGCVRRDGQQFLVDERKRRTKARLMVTVVDDVALSWLFGDRAIGMDHLES